MSIFGRCQWHSEPPKWAITDHGLEVETGPKTDFWQKTYYEFRRDDGHFYYTEAEGDFSAVVTFDGEYAVLYDQAGVMVRGDSQHWLKAGVEFSDGAMNLSTVITRDGESDWSVISIPNLQGPQRVRITRSGGALFSHFQTSEGIWSLMRLGSLPLPQRVKVGPMCCSPERTGLIVRFLDFEVADAVKTPLHGD